MNIIEQLLQEQQQKKYAEFEAYEIKRHRDRFNIDQLEKELLEIELQCKAQAFQKSRKEIERETEKFFKIEEGQRSKKNVTNLEEVSFYQREDNK